MDQAFGWIGEIFRAILKIIPWLVIVPATHGGVAFVRGHRVKEWKPGLQWYWPVVTTYKLMATVRQTQLIQSKVVMTKDLRTVTVGALVTYFVDDVVAALSKIADLPSDIMERTQGAILTEVSENTLEEIQADRRRIQQERDRKGWQRAERLWRARPASAVDRIRSLSGHFHQRARRGRAVCPLDRVLACSRCVVSRGSISAIGTSRKCRPPR